jgi:hypothetical protein
MQMISLSSDCLPTAAAAAAQAHHHHHHHHLELLDVHNPQLFQPLRQPKAQTLVAGVEAAVAAAAVGAAASSDGERLRGQQQNQQSLCLQQAKMTAGLRQETDERAPRKIKKKKKKKKQAPEM